jgi:3-oxoadipate enol-lactonase
MPHQQINGVNLYYEQAGQGDQTLVLIHGNVASLRWWDLVFEELAQSFHVVRIDLRGCGQSGQAESYSVPEYASDVRALIETLALQNVVLVGHSMGGAIAMDIAVHAPALVQGLLLLNPAPAEGLDAPDEPIPLLEQMSRDRNLMKMALAATMPTAAGGELFEKLVDDAMVAGPTVLPNYRSIGEIDYRPQLVGLQIPATILYGALDNLISRELIDRTQQAIPGCELVLYEGIGHSPNVEAPKLFIADVKHFVESRVMQNK